MWRIKAVVGLSVWLTACGGGYAVRPVGRIAADGIGKPVGHLQEAFGEPRKIDVAAARETYVWFLPVKPKDGSPSGLHGCELEVSVDANSAAVLGYSMSNIGWARCSEVERRIRVVAR